MNRPLCALPLSPLNARPSGSFWPTVVYRPRAQIA